MSLPSFTDTLAMKKEKKTEESSLRYNQGRNKHRMFSKDL